MSVSTETPNINDSVFYEAQSCFQKGEWEAGLEKLDILIDRYPSKIELRDLREEMTLRASIDEYEQEDERSHAVKRILGWGVGITLIVIVIAFLYGGASSYSSWFQEQWSGVQQNLNQEVQSLDLTIKFSDAQNYLRAGRSEDALSLLKMIEAQNPDFPGLDQIKADVTRIVYLEEQYQEAIEMQESGELEMALTAFQNIQRGRIKLQ